MNSRLSMTLAVLGLAISATVAAAQGRPDDRRDDRDRREPPAQMDRADRPDQDRRDRDGRGAGDAEPQRERRAPRDAQPLRDGPGPRDARPAPFDRGGAGDGHRRFSHQQRFDGPRGDFARRGGELMQRFRHLPPELQRRIMKRLHERFQMQRFAMRDRRPGGEPFQFRGPRGDFRGGDRFAPQGPRDAGPRDRGPREQLRDRPDRGDRPQRNDRMDRSDGRGPMDRDGAVDRPWWGRGPAPRPGNDQGPPMRRPRQD